jgi:uncharacterized protein YaiI (UPF0178 family)
MQIWVDADACPVTVKEILYRAADRTQVLVTLVANQMLRTPPSAWIRSVQVPSGFDVADKHIADAVAPGDLVITADIPLAAGVVEKDAFALNPRGEFYSRENVRELLDMRNFMETLRSSGVQTGGPEALSSADRQRFANRLDRFLAGAGVKPANGTSVSTRKFASIDRNRGIGERRGSDDE